MITTRERLRVSEALAGLLRRGRRGDFDVFDGVLPLDARHGVLTNQGKAAFEQIVLAAKLQGSRILLPAFFPDDFVGIFRRYGITPVFVDVDPRTYHIDLGRITRAHLQGARALIVLHTFGLPADGPLIRAFCDEHGLVMIEDCARALGASRQGRLVGSFGHYALFSLPKCTPVRQGGVALAEQPLHPDLREARVGIAGVLHALTLVKYPLISFLEAPLYALLADTPVYPREVGNFEPLPAREFDRLGRFVLGAFMPHYRDALAKRRACALRLRHALEEDGCTFQADGGDHIYTALALEVPSSCEPDVLQAYLLKHGIKTTSMWRGALGVSPFARKTWGVSPEETPVALHLSKRLIQLPVSRFQSSRQSDLIVSTVRQCLAAPPRVSPVSEEQSGVAVAR